MSVDVLERAQKAPSSRRKRPPGHLILLLLTFLAGALAISSCQVSGNRAGTPINPANRPTAIAGYTNGKLPSSQLSVYNGSCTVYTGAIRSFSLMVAAAHRDGVNLQPAECYRNYAGQVYWRNWWCQHGICANAATPGYSNHGWGKAADLRDQYGSLTWTSPGYRWMVAHAGAYGWNHPGGVNEAWHWEWVGDGGTMHGASVWV